MKVVVVIVVVVVVVVYRMIVLFYLMYISIHNDAMFFLRCDEMPKCTIFLNYILTYYN